MEYVWSREVSNRKVAGHYGLKICRGSKLQRRVVVVINVVVGCSGNFKISRRPHFAFHVKSIYV